MAKMVKPSLGTITMEGRSAFARRAVAPGTLEVLGVDAQAMLNDLRVEGIEVGPVCVIHTKWGLCLESRLMGDFGALDALKIKGWKLK
jgi:hypothetical protein